MIQIKSLQKTYKNFSLDCSMEVKPGYITGLIGQNGAGKSTVFKAILGLNRPEGGTVRVLGKKPGDMTSADREKLGVVLSDSGFSRYLTIKDIRPVLKHLYGSFDEIKFTELIHRFGLPTDKPIKDFSTGMRAKLQVIAAISHHAELLLLDEPTSGLDVVARDELLVLLRAYMQEDETRGILISSHISSDLETLCDDVYLIHNGRILLHEDTDVLLSDYGVLKLSPEQYDRLDKQYVRCTASEPYGYQCLTDQRQFYRENAPDVVIEKGSVDGVMTMMIKGGRT